MPECGVHAPPGCVLRSEPPSPPGSWPGPGGRAELGPRTPRHRLTCWGETLLVCPAWELLLSGGPTSPPCLSGFCLSCTVSSPSRLVMPESSQPLLTSRPTGPLNQTKPPSPPQTSVACPGIFH